MFTIRQDQLDALAASSRRRMETRLAQALAELWPDEAAGLGPDGLPGLVGYGVRAAAAHGIVADQDVARFLNLWIAVGPEFDAEPWARAILDVPVTAPWMHVEQLLHAAGPELDRRDGIVAPAREAR